MATDMKMGQQAMNNKHVSPHFELCLVAQCVHGCDQKARFLNSKRNDNDDNDDDGRRQMICKMELTATSFECIAMRHISRSATVDRNSVQIKIRCNALFSLSPFEK